MRANICVFYHHTAYKIVWVNEDARGVYIGFFGVFRGSHLSYHRDGTRHWKWAPSKATVLETSTMTPDKMCPIHEIRKPAHLITNVIPVSESNVSAAASLYKPDAAGTTGVFLSAQALLGEQQLSVDSYLVHQSHEEDAVKLLWSQDNDSPAPSLLTFDSFRLDEFPEHRCVIAFSKHLDLEKQRV